jgi:hypothetical protein
MWISWFQSYELFPNIHKLKIMDVQNQILWLAKLKKKKNRKLDMLEICDW